MAKNIGILTSKYIIDMHNLEYMLALCILQNVVRLR